MFVIWNIYDFFKQLPKDRFKICWLLFFFLSRVQSRIIRILQLLKDWGVHFVYCASYASLLAMKLEKLPVNDKTTAWCQTNTSPKHYIKRCKQVTNTKNELWKTVRLTTFQNHNRHPFVSARLVCVASVSVRFRSKERGTRVKDRAKNGASKRAKPKIPSHVCPSVHSFDTAPLMGNFSSTELNCNPTTNGN